MAVIDFNAAVTVTRCGQYCMHDGCRQCGIQMPTHVI